MNVRPLMLYKSKDYQRVTHRRDIIMLLVYQLVKLNLDNKRKRLNYFHLCSYPFKHIGLR